MKASWKVEPLGQLCDFQRGLTYAKGDEVEKSGNAVLRATNIDLATNLLDLSQLKYINDRIVVPNTKKVRRDSLLICTASGSKSHLGKVAYIDDDYGFAFGGFMGLISPKNGLVPRYLFHLMTSGAYKTFVGNLSDGANINNLKFDDLKDFQVPYPERGEQERIVGILDEAFEGITTAKANAARNLENARLLLLSQLDRSFSHPRDGWLQKNLGDVCQIRTGKKDVNEGNPEGQFPFFTCAAEHTYSDTFSFDCEALLVSGNGNVGQVSYYSGRFEAYQRTYVLSGFDGVHGRYLFRVLDKRLGVAVSKQKLGNTMPYIKMGMLRDFPIPIPPINQQKDLADQLDALATATHELEDSYRQKILALDALKRSMLNQAFNGELGARIA